MLHVLFVTMKLILQRRRQTIVSTLGVAIGMTAFVVMSSLMLGFQKHFIKQVIDLDAHISVKPKFNYDEKRILRRVFGEEVIIEVLGSKPKEVRDRIGNYRELMDRYSGKGGILGISPHLRGNAIVRFGPKDIPVGLFGIDPALEGKATSIERYLENNRLSVLNRKRNGIILGKLVARDLGVKDLGKKVILIAPNGVSQIFEVVDFFNSGITTIDNSRAYIHIRTMQKLYDRPNEVNELVVRVADVDDAVRIARDIEDETGYDAQSWQEAYSNFLQLFKIQKTITYLVVGAILIVSSFGIFNILMMTVLEKQRDIAILKAMGYTSRDITLIFLLQGLIVGVVGVLIGGIAAYGLQEYLESVEIDLEGLVRAKGFILDRSFWYYVGGSLFALVSSWLASVYPARRASRLNPVDIFRSGGV
ncbi:ABC transporter permease [Hydrogenivirga sp.]